MPDPSIATPPSGNPKGGTALPEAPGLSPNEPGDSPASNPERGQGPDSEGGGSGYDGHGEGEEGDGEVEALITPRAAVLDELQVTEHEFEWALGRSLDLLEETDDDDDAALEDIEIVLNGRTFRLEEVAEVEIGGDLSELGPLPDPADAEEE